MAESDRSHDTIGFPKMQFDIWGTAEEARTLDGDTKATADEFLGIRPGAGYSTGNNSGNISESLVEEADLSALAAIVGVGNVTVDDDHRRPRAAGKSVADLLRWRTEDVVDAPDAVVAPRTDAEVLEVLHYCSTELIAVVPFGGGSSVVGGLAPLREGFRAVLSVDLCHFDSLEELDSVSEEATLGAGMSGPAAEAALAEQGFQLGHYPQSFRYATIGGFAATRSSGQNSAGYGRFDSMVTGLTIVTPTGTERIGRAPSSAAGPDIREVFLGSEGAFGIITSVRVRVHKLPEATEHEAFSFPDFATGAQALRAVEQSGAAPTVIRLSDETETAINLTSANEVGSENSLQGCLCITMFEGTVGHAATEHAAVREILLAHGGTSVGAGPAESWQHGRFDAPTLRDALIDAGAIVETLETATQWSNIAELRDAVTTAVTDTFAGQGSSALVMCHISHLYPTGCSLYFTVAAAQSEMDPVVQWLQVKAAASAAIINAGATITHHHAVGTDHRPYMLDEVGPLGVRVLRAIKNELDPAGVCNPAKMIP